MSQNAMDAHRTLPAAISLLPTLLSGGGTEIGSHGEGNFFTFGQMATVDGVVDRLFADASRYKHGSRGPYREGDFVPISAVISASGLIALPFGSGL